MNPAQPNSSTLARGVLAKVSEGSIVLSLPGTEYQLHLVVDSPVQAQQNKPTTGRIEARAMRVDIVHTGGRFIEPVYGRPRRIQGRVIAADPTGNTITVNCDTPFVCYLTAQQNPGDFPVGSLVSFDIEKGARFEPMIRSPEPRVQSQTV